MIQTLYSVADSIHHAMKNPFGLDFEMHQQNIYVPLGSVINCIGYNDHLERIVGATRIIFALIALTRSNLTTKHDTDNRLIASAHIMRGVLEMLGDFEKHLLILDSLFTVYNITYRILNRLDQSDYEKLI